MTTDQFLLLVHSQWERGLIVPKSLEPDDPLLVVAKNAIEAGFVLSETYHITFAGLAQCFSLTKKGWGRIGEIVGAEMVFK